METFLQDLKYAARMLLKKPAFTLVAVLSLTLGIGANSTIFTMTKAIFMQSIGVKDPSTVVIVFSNANNRGAAQQQYLPISYLNSRDIREKSNAFAGASVFIGSGASLIVSGQQVGVFCPLVNWDFFEIMGIKPELGRWFRPDEDDAPGAHPVAVLSHGLWKRQFGGDANIVGQTIRLSGQPFSVIGVAPSDFHDLGLIGSPDVYIPIAMHGPMLTGVQKDWFDTRGARMTLMLARLKPGVSYRATESALTNFGQVLQREYPKDNGGRGIMMMRIADTVIPPQQHGDWVRAGTLMG